MTSEWATVIVGLASAFLLFAGQVVTRVWGRREGRRSSDSADYYAPTRFECGAMDNRGLMRTQFEDMHRRFDRVHERITDMADSIDGLAVLVRGYDRARRQESSSRLALKERGDDDETA